MIHYLTSLPRIYILTPHTDALYDGLYAYLGREVLLPIGLIPTI